ncbi:hypothetical protein PMAYCL1PPCAC_27126, partial [Pristionchus mayeri]
SYSFWLALSFITIERALASHFVDSYEEKFNSIEAQLVIIALFVSEHIYSRYTLALFPTPTMLIVCFCNTFVNLGVMYFIKRVNTRRNGNERTLSYRYQVKENVLV